MKRFRPAFFSLVLFTALGSGGVARAQSSDQSTAPPVTAATPVPRSVPFNGQVLKASGEAHTGAVALTFALYTDQTGGTPLWTEQQQVTLDSAGRYAVILGSASADGLPADAFAAGTPRWLGVQTDGEKEQPRFMLLSVPYALKAGDADTIAGKPPTEFVLSTHLSDSVKSTLKEEGYTPKPSNPTASTIGRLAKFIDVANGTGDSVVTESGGLIGINTASPCCPFHVNASTTYQAMRLTDSHIVGSSFTVQPIGFAGLHGYSLLATGPGASTGSGYLTVYDEFIGQYRMVIDPSGKVGIGTTTPTQTLDVAGNVNVSGNIGAKYQDVAEWVETAEPLEAGTVVIVDPSESNRVLPSPKAYDTRVAGAVSKQPGLILGEQSDTKAMIAQSGRVRIKVDAKYGAIRIGDLLVTSPTPGYAMRSKAIKVGGQAIHRPGTLLGKALEALPNGKGEILVLLTLQ
jgi:hypothetical protein